MAIGWLTVLQSVPWTDVVRNAPKVAVGAKKLWNSVGKKPPPGAHPAAGAPAAFVPEVQSVSALALRVRDLETDAADLQAQIVASSEVINALADQNTQLIIRVDTLRVRMLWLAGALAVLGLVCGTSLLLVLMR
ncbi:MAG: hypothetical protein Q8R56_04205 [Polaromonas sp.]|uniref:hypothetical protein n=1 Tax=Polaromonas sp. TaxID=1869339 RepID=UPI00272EF8A9|nr:hypothetical protein [Polaromonas sp.]MDP3707274.1 hypothetical protein [Polaromonas sp.]